MSSCRATANRSSCFASALSQLSWTNGQVNCVHLARRAVAAASSSLEAGRAGFFTGSQLGLTSSNLQLLPSPTDRVGSRLHSRANLLASRFSCTFPLSRTTFQSRSGTGWWWSCVHSLKLPSKHVSGDGQCQFSFSLSIAREVIDKSMLLIDLRGEGVSGE